MRNNSQESISYLHCCHIYQLELGMLIEEAYEHRSTHLRQKRDEHIELTLEI